MDDVLAMINIDDVLSDEFVLFSKNISAIHEEMKVLSEEFKVKYDEYAAKKKELYDRAEKEKIMFDESQKPIVFDGKMQEGT